LGGSGWQRVVAVQQQQDGISRRLRIRARVGVPHRAATSLYAASSDGCIGMEMASRPVAALSLGPKKSATAERTSFDMARARGSHTQQWIPRRPE